MSDNQTLTSNVANSVSDAVVKGTWGAGTSVDGGRVFGVSDAATIAGYLGEISQGNYRDAFGTALNYSAGLMAGEFVSGFLIGLGVGGPAGAVVGAILGAAIGFGLDQSEVVKDWGREWYDKIREEDQSLPPWEDAAQNIPRIQEEKKKVKDLLRPDGSGMWDPQAEAWRDFTKNLNHNGTYRVQRYDPSPSISTVTASKRWPKTISPAQYSTSTPMVSAPPAAG
ncbi:hypothetical protein ACFSQE_07705 [Vogesella fluminis]|uniref:hypothetical protein n=1 Tax=Vogesella fluminis TaxID=1069161 RepID=UPI00362D5F03